MPLRLHRRANGIWYAHGTVDGRRIRQSLGTRDARQAEEARAQLEARAWQQSVYGPEVTVKFEDAALAYLQDGGSPRYVEGVLRAFRGRALRSIKPKDVRDAARKLHPGCAGATLNRQVITPARAIINHAAEQGWCAPIRIRQFATEKPARRAVTPDWIRAFRQGAFATGRPQIAALAWFLFETGCRLSEATGLERVDLVACTADLGRTKNGEHYRVPFSAALRDELAALPPRGGRVFGYARYDGVYKGWRAAARAAGIAYVPPHQAGRHSFATALERDGWSANAIAEAGRWKSVRLVQETYVHSDATARAAAERIGTLLAQDTPDAVVKTLKPRGK